MPTNSVIPAGHYSGMAHTAQSSIVLTSGERRVRCRVLQASLSAGDPVRGHGAAVVIAAGSWLFGGEPDDWGPTELAEPAWHGVVSWCREVDVPLPHDAGRAAVWLARVLDAAGPRDREPAVREIIAA